jgi:urease gamma subunit
LLSHRDLALRLPRSLSRLLLSMLNRITRKRRSPSLALEAVTATALRTITIESV